MLGINLLELAFSCFNDIITDKTVLNLIHLAHYFSRIVDPSIPLSNLQSFLYRTHTIGLLQHNYVH
jgi:hypothetical protein